MSEDLVTWLRAQIDEDEVSDWPHRRACQIHKELPVPTGHPLAGPMSCNCDAATRWLAEVEAKRRILDLAEEAAAEHKRVDELGPRADVHRGLGIDEYEGMVEGLEMRADALAEAVRLLALPYADREGYREEEWRP